MKIRFRFAPCKSDQAFKLIPQGAVKKSQLVGKVCKLLKGKIVADTGYLTIIACGKARISVTEHGEIVLREVNAAQARKIADKIMKEFIS